MERLISHLEKIDREEVIEWEELEGELEGVHVTP
jgi:hypothetical protein